MMMVLVYFSIFLFQILINDAVRHAFIYGSLYRFHNWFIFTKIFITWYFISLMVMTFVKICIFIITRVFDLVTFMITVLMRISLLSHTNHDLSFSFQHILVLRTSFEFWESTLFAKWKNYRIFDNFR